MIAGNLQMNQKLLITIIDNYCNLIVYLQPPNEQEDLTIELYLAQSANETRRLATLRTSDSCTQRGKSPSWLASRPKPRRMGRDISDPQIRWA